MRLRLLVPPAALVAVVAGCGGTAHKQVSASAITSPSACRLTATTKAAIARSQRDLVKLKAVAARQKVYTELGTPALQLATGRYLDDLTNSPIDGIRVNRLIDLGASVVAGYCGQCFQMLEANRPIPALKYSGRACAS